MWLYIILLGSVIVAIGVFLQSKQSGDQADRIENQQELIAKQQRRIEQLQRDLMGMETGGDSYPKFKLSWRGDAQPGDQYKGIQFHVKNHGEHRLKDLNMRVVDIGNFYEKSSSCISHHLSNLDLNCAPTFPNIHKISGAPSSRQPGLIDIDKQDIGDVKAHDDIIIFELWFNKEPPTQGYNIYFESSHTCWMFEFRVIFSEKIEYAHRLMKIGEKREDWELIENDSSDNYPLDNNGDPVFYKDTPG